MFIASQANDPLTDDSDTNVVNKWLSTHGRCTQLCLHNHRYWATFQYTNAYSNLTLSNFLLVKCVRRCQCTLLLLYRLQSSITVGQKNISAVILRPFQCGGGVGGWRERRVQTKAVIRRAASVSIEATKNYKEDRSIVIQNVISSVH